MLDKKLQLKDGQTLAVLYSPIRLDLSARLAPVTESDAALMFVTNSKELSLRLPELQRSVKADKLTWMAYPKARQLGTDINRTIIWKELNANGLDPVRQIAIDDVWSALRIKQAPNLNSS